MQIKLKKNKLKKVSDYFQTVNFSVKALHSERVYVLDIIRIVSTGSTLRSGFRV